MKKLIGSLLLAASFVAVGSSAHAADINIDRPLVWTDSTSTFNGRFGDGTTGQSFLANYTFNVSTISSVTSAVVSIALDGLSKVGIDSFVLTSSTGQTYTGSSVYDAATDTQTFNLRANNLVSGLYTLSVAGTVLGTGGGSFAGNISIAPVPEASTTAMMIGGLALVGYAATRRRRKTGAAPSLQGSMMAA